jgi:transcriptional regulator with XRE-family HTH domain
METQGQRIKKIRLALNLSQEEFGKIFDITKQYVYSLEKDKLTLNNEKLVKLLLDYNVNANYLLGGIGMMFMEPKQKNEFVDFKNEILFEVRNMLKSEGVIK